MLRPLIAVVALSLLPAVAEAQRGKDKCSVEAVDAVHLAGGPAMRDCDVDTKASLRREPRITFEFPRDATCLIAEFEFVVDTAGVPDTTGTIVVVDGNNTEFVAYMRSQLGSFRYKPAQHEGQPVRQVARIRKALKPPTAAFTVQQQAGGLTRGGSLPPQNRSRPTAPCR